MSVAAGAAARYDRTITRWGQGSEMTAYEAALWHISDNPTLRAASVVVELLDTAPEWERFRAGHSWALGRVPRLRQRVVSDPVRLGPPAWADTRVDLSHHLRRVALGAGGGLRDVLRIASAMHEEVFAPDRPLWLATLVEGLPGQQAAYVLKFHHAMADDQALVALFELLHSHVRHPTVSMPHLPAGHHESLPPLRLTASHVLNAVHRGPRAAARIATALVRTGAGAISDPGAAVKGGIAGGRSVTNEVRSVRWSGSPLLAARGHHRAFDMIDVPIERLRAAGAAAGARISHVVLAATVDGLARYHSELGTTLDALPVAVPLRLRLDGSSDRMPRARIVVPIAAADRLERIAMMRDLCDEAERRPNVDVLRLASPLVSRTPTVLAARLMEQSMRPLAVQGFIVPGLDRDAYLAGARVTRLFSFAPTSGCALSVTLVTHQQTSCIGFNLDTSAVTEQELMGRCLSEAFSDAVDET
jgi:diacylglycerol O-acyltransferase